MEERQAEHEYEAPALRELGTVEQLTAGSADDGSDSGNTNPT